MGELLLGTRRASRARTIAKRIAIGAALVAGVVLVVVLAFRRATNYPVPRGSLGAAEPIAVGGRLRLGASSLERVGDLWVLRLEGEPYELGGAHARLLGGAAFADGVLDRALLGERPPTSWLGRLRQDARLRWRYRLLADAIPAPRRAELAGLAAGLARAVLPAGGARPTTPGYQRLVWRQAALDVGSVPGAPLPFGGVASALAFARLHAAADEPARLIVGRTVSLADAGPPGVPVVFVVRPAGAIPFAAVGWGGQVGVLTGVNAEGVAIMTDPAVADDVRRPAAAEPIALVARDVLEQARDLDGAVALLRGARVLGAATFLVADRDDGRFVVVERTPGKAAVVRPEGAAAIGDLLQAPEFAKDAENNRARRGGRTADRLTRLTERLRDGAPPRDKASEGQAPEAVMAAVAVLRDRAPAAGAAAGAEPAGLLDDVDAAHTAVLDLTAGWLWVAEGPGAGGRFLPFDLEAELRGQPPRPAPGALPADPAHDAAAARRLRLAHAELRLASRLLRARQRRAAAEANARAMALAPELAGPYKVAGDLARAAGQDEVARGYYRRFLELPSADRGAIEEVRALLGTP